MSLNSGSVVGSYQILGLLGVGGMGEVYRALDTKLGRNVAVKVVPDAFLSDSDRITRFEREAKLLASLNHPNIASLYGMEESDGRHFLVMELVEGETLADRLARGPIAQEDALAIAQQIAEALEAAHERGVVHRDLKPANVKVTPEDRVKVLDFGLAKALEAEPVAAHTNSPTLSMRATQVGVILGTAAYMSPEQAKGLPADQRSDIFSFGGVLFEMLSGRQPFSGDTAADVLASVLVQEPDLTSLPASVHPRVRDLVRRCLEKQRRRRWQAIGDVRAEVEAIRATPVADVAPAPVRFAPRRIWWHAAGWLVAALLGSSLTYVAMSRLRPTAPRPGIVRFSLIMPDGQPFSGTGRRFVAISPDGSRIAYFLNGRLLVRSLAAEDDARAIRGVEATQQNSSLVFSPDSQSLAYWSPDRTIKTVRIDGGVPATVCAAEGSPYGMSWTTSGILFTQIGPPDRIYRVPAGGGQPEPVVTANTGETLDSPQLLPDGDSLLFTSNGAPPSPDSWNRATIIVQSLKTGKRKILISGGADGQYLATGHLLYAVGGTLFGIAFDAAHLQTVGQAMPVLDGVRRATAGASGAAEVSFSESGVLAYVPGPPGVGSSKFDIVLSDRTGKTEPLHLPPAPYEYPRASPDGKRIAFDTDDGKDATVWVYDLAGTTGMSRLTFAGRNRFPIWSGDGQHVAFQSNRDGDLAIYWQRADRPGAAERLTQAEAGTSHIPDSWSRAGDLMAFTVAKGSSFSIWMYSAKDRKSVELDGTKSNAPPTAVFSPDGRWIAYSISESTSNATHVFVQPVPATRERYQLFAKGVDNPHHPLWSPDGSELFYVPRVGALEVVTVVTRPAFTFSNPTPVPRPFPTAAPTTPRTFDVVSTSAKLVSVTNIGPAATAGSAVVINVALNWFDELNARVPPGR